MCSVPASDWMRVALATVTGRLGYAANNWLLYGKGGVAWADEEASNTTTNAGVVTDRNSGSETRTGWTIGAGVEWVCGPGAKGHPVTMFL